MTNTCILVNHHPFGVLEAFGRMVAEGLRGNGAVFLTVDAQQCRQLRRHLDRLERRDLATLFLPDGGRPSMPLPRPGSLAKTFDLVVFATLDRQISAEFCREDDYRGAIPAIARRLPADRIAGIARRAQAMVETGYGLDPVDTVAEVLGTDDVMARIPRTSPSRRSSTPA